MMTGSFDGISREIELSRGEWSPANNDQASSMMTCMPVSKNVQSSIDIPPIMERTAAMR